MFVGFIFCNTLVTSNNIPYRVMSGIIYSTNQSTTTYQIFWYYINWVHSKIYCQSVNMFNCLVYHWRWKMNGRSPHMTLYGMLLDINASLKKSKKRLIWIRLVLNLQFRSVHNQYPWQCVLSTLRWWSLLVTY